MAAKARGGSADTAGMKIEMLFYQVGKLSHIAKSATDAWSSLRTWTGSCIGVRKSRQYTGAQQDDIHALAGQRALADQRALAGAGWKPELTAGKKTEKI